MTSRTPNTRLIAILCCYSTLSLDQAQRIQTNLENEARTFSGPEHFETLTNSDLSQRTVESDFDPLQWGSNPSLSLARTNKLSGIPPGKDSGPLVPESKPKPAPRVEVEPPREQRQQAPQKPRQMYYSTPLGSGHLLEPIEEVRYSLETDRGHVSQDTLPERNA